MPGKQAKILAPASLDQMLEHVSSYRFAERARVLILLSAKAGLRAGEIAGLTWEMVLDARGRVSDTIAIEDRIAKMQSGRRVPMHPQLKGALVRLQRRSRSTGAIIKSRKGGHMRANSIVCWFGSLYRTLGLRGCSSHSGRRTFVTNAAKKTHEAGGSLRDVQLLAGHRSIATTEKYIEGDSHAQRRLVQLL